MAQKKTAMTGAEAAAYAMRQINPSVVAAYPITPQTPIMENFSKHVANGYVDTNLIDVESEHSAMSATLGAAAAGVRAMTATASNGLALMFEVVYITASLRQPIVMNVGNRAIAGPINIHCDHSDSMGARDSGWMQMYAANPQEAYDHTIMGIRIAEHMDVRLPIMCCQDGFLTTHNTQNLTILDDKAVQDFIGPYKPLNPLLDVNNPVTIGPFDLQNYYFEHKRQQHEAMENAKRVMKEVFEEYSKKTGRHYDFTDDYMLEDAEYVIVALSSVSGTIKEVIDKLRAQGKKVGLLRPRVYRPFPHEIIIPKLTNAKCVAVIDRTSSFGALGGPLFEDIRNAMYDYNSNKKPMIINYIAGLGGRDIMESHIEQIYKELEDLEKTKDLTFKVRFLGVRE